MLRPVALIVGGLKGYGAEFAQSILKRGTQVVIAIDINSKSVQESEKKEILEYDENQVNIIDCDFNSSKNLNETFEKVTSTFGPLGVLCNNFEKSYHYNDVTPIIESTFKGIQTMSRQNGGQGGLIINLASVLNFDMYKTVCVDETNYDIISFSHSFRSSLPYQMHGIQVKSLCYLSVDTDVSIEKSRTLGRLDLAECETDDVIECLERKDIGSVFATNEPIKKLYEVELEAVINALFM